MRGRDHGRSGARSSQPSAAALSARLQRQLLRKTRLGGTATSATMTAAAGRRHVRTADLLAEEPRRPKLSEEEWARVQQRSRWRKHSEAPCPICLSPFRTEEQVLLSCAHVFHATCLRNFERFAVCKDARTCPMCRHGHYEKRRCRDGADAYLAAMATRIQKRWRGFVARRAFERLVVAEAAPSSRLRQRHNMRRFERAAEGIAREVEQKESDLDRFFAELDATMTRSRAVMASLDAQTEHISLDEWGDIRKRALQMEQMECPICMGALASHDKDVHLLSCSHLFHADCLNSFEAFVDDVRCPLCRSPYSRITL